MTFRRMQIRIYRALNKSANVDDEITDSQKAKKKLDQTKKLLDTLGVGKSLEKGGKQAG